MLDLLNSHMAAIVGHNTPTTQGDTMAGRNSDIYECVENGGNVYDDIADMSLDEMLDYFGDTDPTAFL